MVHDARLVLVRGADHRFSDAAGIALMLATLEELIGAAAAGPG